MADKKHVARIQETIQFADGEDRQISPLTIKSLREFVKIIEGLELSTESMDDDSITKMADAAFIVLHQSNKDISREQIEDILDLDTFSKIMTVAMGNRLSDPNLAEAEV